MDTSHTGVGRVQRDCLLVKRHTVWLIAGALLIGSVLAFVRLVSKPELYAYKREAVTVPLPVKCAKYRRTYREDEWNPVTETYPINHEWMDCIGVGYK